MNRLKPCLGGILLAFFFFTAGSCRDESPNDPADRADRTELLRLVNEARAAGCNCGTTWFPPAAALTWNDTLETAAQNHCSDMARKNFFSHTGSDGATVSDRVTRLGYRYRMVGENIAKGQLSEQQVMEGWLASPGHCANLMNGQFREMGVARKEDYWTQVLGRRLDD